MARVKFSRIFAILVLLVAVAAVAYLFFTGIDGLDRGQDQHGVEQLETALRRAAVSCYAAEGKYPDNADHLRDFYGVQINDERYAVHYEVFAENLMPEITVTKK